MRMQEELKGMAGRIKSMRAQLLQALKDVDAPGTWDHVVDQIGMFSFLGVTKVAKLHSPCVRLRISCMQRCIAENLMDFHSN